MCSRRQLLAYVLGFALLAPAGCASRSRVVELPPRVDLTGFDYVGLIEFSSNAAGDLHARGTQEFMQALQSAQPGVRVLELGEAAALLRAVDRSELDPEAIQAIARKYHVDAIIAGHLGVKDLAPRVQVQPRLEALKAKAEVEASLSAKLFEAERGATLWTNSAAATATVAHLRVASNGLPDFGARAPEDAYANLVQGLVSRVTADFRPSYARR